MKKRKRKKKVIYEDDFDGVDIKNLRVVKAPEWLPSPEEVARALKNVRTTILLDADTISYFKQQAKKHGVSYQKMIREVLREYRQRDQAA